MSTLTCTCSSPAVKTSQHCLSFLKASVWKITSIWWLGGAVTLFVMDVKVALSSRLWKRLEKTRRVEQKGGGIDRVCVQKKKKGTFLSQFSRKYVGLAHNFFTAGNGQLLGSTVFPLVYFNRSYWKHMFIIWDSPVAYNDFAA